MIAVCEVLPPASVIRPATAALCSCAVSAGDRSYATTIASGGGASGPVSRAEQVAQHALEHELDVAAPLAEVLVLDAVEHAADVVDRAAQRPLGVDLLVADVLDAPRRPGARRGASSGAR